MLDLHNKHLKCIGGQHKVYCTLHKTPLILHPAKRQRQSTTKQPSNQENKQTSQCSCRKDSHRFPNGVKTWDVVDFYCLKNAHLICSYIGCTVAICMDHFKWFMLDTEDQCYMLTSTSCILESEDNFFNEVLLAQEPDFEDIDNRYDEDNNDYNVLDDEDHDNANIVQTLEEYEDTLDTSIIGKDQLGPSDNFEYAGNLLPEYERHDSDGSDCEFDDQLDHVPSTNANTEMLDIQLEAPEEIKSCPLHVLLNRQGHLLIRKDAKLRMNRRHANFFHRIISTTKGKTLPLVYAEALLFPDIFFFNTNEGAILGAIPTALWTDAQKLKHLGLASMRNHSKTRLSDPSILCSTDSRYHFMMFDCLVNLGMRGHDSRLILHRGFADKQDKDGVSFNENNSDSMYADNVEDKTNVHKLASLIGKSHPPYFFTQSCNQSTCRGLGKLREWVINDAAIDCIKIKYNLTLQEARYILWKTAAVFIQQVCDVIAKLWMRYIIYSKEEPLHKIEWAWWRKEFQNEAGNVSHIHAI
jgi:hypothetical protein